jgi:hypothetical protein
MVEKQKKQEEKGENYHIKIYNTLFEPTGISKVIGYHCKEHGDYLSIQVKLDGLGAYCPTPNCNKKLEAIDNKLLGLSGSRPFEPIGSFGIGSRPSDPLKLRLEM